MIDTDVYRSRRQRFIDKMGEGGVALFVAPPERQRSHDTNYPYRPSSDIVYLTGFEEPETVVVLAPGHADGDCIMFVRDRDPEKETWDGRRAGPKGAIDRFGADAAHPIDRLDELLPALLRDRETLWYTLGVDPTFDQKVARWMNTLRFRRGEPPAAPRQIADARDILHDMRLIKQPDELELMRKAATITAEAHEKAMRFVRPGLHEYEVQAVIEHHFLSCGATAPAYNSIVGTGVNATILHYTENRDRLGEDDVLLIDAGCEYRYYAADITRSYPVSGRFSPAQRDVYQAVLDAELAAIADVRPGTRFGELIEGTTRRLTQSLIDMGILSGSVDQAIEEGTYKTFYPHKVGHWLGSDVHDVGSYYDEQGATRPLEPGMVTTIEPGLYFPENADVPDEFKGIGVRIEDDVLVTNEGPENLTARCPKTIEELESIIGTGL